MPRWDSDGHARICLIPMPRISGLRAKARDAGFYIAGALFALGWWFLIDAAVYSKNWNYDNGDKHVSIEFVDWVPGICSTVGMIIIECIDKASLREDSSFYGDGVSVVWRARFFLFIGFAFMAGGLAGSVRCVVVRYGDRPARKPV
ncbi:hypothetical protein BGZ58_006917 [Dissophora ornata]|nr:hypothetical protein BGZ58_006917 [Dissophora ornata]